MSSWSRPTSCVPVVLAFVAVTCGRSRIGRIEPALTPPPVRVATAPILSPVTSPAPSPLSPTAAALPGASDSTAFERTVRPILSRTCAPCHVPAGRMYDRMPFDNPQVVREHREGILRRLKGDDRAAVETWLATGGGP